MKSQEIWSWKRKKTQNLEGEGLANSKTKTSEKPNKNPLRKELNNPKSWILQIKQDH